MDICWTCTHGDCYYLILEDKAHVQALVISSAEGKQQAPAHIRRKERKAGNMCKTQSRPRIAFVYVLGKEIAFGKSDVTGIGNRLNQHKGVRLPGS